MPADTVPELRGQDAAAALGRPVHRSGRTGSIEAGDGVSVIHRPEHGVTSGDVFRGLSPEQTRLLAAAAAGGDVSLSPEIRKVLRTLAARGAMAG